MAAMSHCCTGLHMQLWLVSLSWLSRCSSHVCVVARLQEREEGAKLFASGAAAAPTDAARTFEPGEGLEAASGAPAAAKRTAAGTDGEDEPMEDGVAGGEEGEDGDEERASTAAAAAASGAPKAGVPSSGPTPEQRTAIQAAIANVQTLQDMQRLEQVRVASPGCLQAALELLWPNNLSGHESTAHQCS
jgi:hypothetical protein